MRWILITLAMLLSGAAGAGAVLLYPMIWPKPPAPIVSLWRVFPLDARATVPGCKQGFARAFQAAGFAPTRIAVEDGEGIQVRAVADDVSALGLCMTGRAAALVVMSGFNVADLDRRVQAVTVVAMAPAPQSAPPPAPPQQQQPGRPQQ